ncbi:MAG TPA: type II toxin-antitoxin system VapB family antitoxin [Bryobacteraceae bacterium]|nr:type II toxin-antitoxin system VapB family antitoxin [Bryobacteraceae bacterium]
MKDRWHASLNVKSAEAHSIAVRLAKLQGTTISAAVIQALRAQLRRQEHLAHPTDEVARMEAFSRRLSRLPVLDHRSEDEILGYGPGGYPNGD